MKSATEAADARQDVLTEGFRGKLANVTYGSVCFVNADSGVLVDQLVGHDTEGGTSIIQGLLMRHRLLAACLLTGACLAVGETPSIVAIKNAKIVPVAGPAIAKGTVVIRNGLIEAVGAGVTEPADAWVVDGEGLTVYPGLIDGLSTLGLPSMPAIGEVAAARR